MPVLSYLNRLDKDMLLKILLEPKNSIIQQYQALFEMDNIKLSIESKYMN